MNTPFKIKRDKNLSTEINDQKYTSTKNNLNYNRAGSGVLDRLDPLFSCPTKTLCYSLKKK